MIQFDEIMYCNSKKVYNGVKALDYLTEKQNGANVMQSQYSLRTKSIPLWQILTDSRKSFTARFSKKFAIKPL